MRNIICAIAGTLALTRAAAGAPPPGPVDDPTLIAKAKAEGAVVLYGVTQTEAINAMAKRFEATYGINVQWIRLQGNSVPPRLMTEARGGHIEADVVEGESGLETEQIKRGGFFAQFRPPEARGLPAGTFDPEGYWTANALLTEAICYNPVRLKAAGLKPPRTWADLEAKEWRGQFALFSGSYEWYGAMKKFFGKERAEAMLRAYAANQPQLEGSHQLGIQLTVSGEVTGAANVYAYGCLLEKSKGSPIELVNPVPTIVEVSTVGVLKDGPHPNAARLLARWLLSHETEQWSVDVLGKLAPRKDVRNNPLLVDPKVRYVVSDTSNLDAFNADIQTFRTIFNIPN